MKSLILVLLFAASCTFHVENQNVPCGYDETPYYEAPYVCDEHCCVWRTEGIYYYSECSEIWCYDEYACAWQLYEYSCYPI